MESMLAEQQYLRTPIRPFELDNQNNNLTLEEKALLAARSQLFLRAAAAAAGPYGPLVTPGLPGLYGLPPGAGALWGQWACLAAHQLPRPLYPPLPSPLTAPLAAPLRYSPYPPPRRSSPIPQATHTASHPSPSSSPDRQEAPPQSPT